MFSTCCSLSILGVRWIIAGVPKFHYCGHIQMIFGHVCSLSWDYTTTTWTILSTSVEQPIVGKPRAAKRDRISSRCLLSPKYLRVSFPLAAAAPMRIYFLIAQTAKHLLFLLTSSCLHIDDMNRHDWQVGVKVEFFKLSFYLKHSMLWLLYLSSSFICEITERGCTRITLHSLEEWILYVSQQK